MNCHHLKTKILRYKKERFMLVIKQLMIKRHTENNIDVF